MSTVPFTETAPRAGVTTASGTHGVDARTFRLIGSACAGVIAVLSIVYAVAFLFIAPSAQRQSNVTDFFTSYLRHPAGMRIASSALAVSGVLSGIAVVALIDWLRAGRRDWPMLQWTSIAAVAGGLLTSVHALGGLVETN